MKGFTKVSYLKDKTKIIWLPNSDQNCLISHNGLYQLIDKERIQKLIEGFWIEVQEDDDFEEIDNSDERKNQ